MKIVKAVFCWFTWPFRQSRQARQERSTREFCKRFPCGGLSWCNFRPEFDGFWVNAWSAIDPQRDAAATRESALELLANIAQWLRDHKSDFEPGDVIQLIVGFDASVKSSCRQIFKCYVPAGRLAELHGTDFDAVGGLWREMDLWSAGVKYQDAVALTNPDPN